MSEVEALFKKAHIDIRLATGDSDYNIEPDADEVREFFYDSIWAMIQDDGEIENRDLITKQAQAMIDALEINTESLGYETEGEYQDFWNHAMDEPDQRLIGCTHTHEARINVELKDDAPDEIKRSFQHSMIKQLADNLQSDFEFGFTPDDIDYTNQDAPKPRLSPPPSLDNRLEPNAPTPPAPRR